MSGLTDSNTTDSFDNTLVGIMGGTDNSRIGNVGDRLKVDTSQVIEGNFRAWSKKVSWLDMNALNGGVARDTNISTTFVNIFSYSGSGYFQGFNLSLEDKSNWYVRLIVDNTDLFIGSVGIFTGDMQGKNIYGWETGDLGDIRNVGMIYRDETFLFESPSMPIKFNSSVILQARHNASSKKFRAGLVMLEKTT